MKKNWLEPNVISLNVQETNGGPEGDTVWDGWDYDYEPIFSGEILS